MVAYDEELADRLRDALSAADVDVAERSMFGGLAFMVGGHMTVGIIGDDLMVRVGAQAYEEVLGHPGARPMDFPGKPSKGMVYLAASGMTDASLEAWVQRGLTFTASLPPK